jgi:hypothetical protein
MSLMRAVAISVKCMWHMSLYLRRTVHKRYKCVIKYCNGLRIMVNRHLTLKFASQQLFGVEEKHKLYGVFSFVEAATRLNLCGLYFCE